ncbi:hypothetical protein B0H66DRAFT_604995 [Apodospora peruviana]|uniref:UDP-N-acetylglucosamine transferase subunit ALG13 n=1 Tax=Apodospora peruviana TaxID=516989 RepID=A0AAE0I185_9PEZI|nr:hypothetical protein B0H66DRAFT_604995 [Apodospora peruviana]
MPVVTAPNTKHADSPDGTPESNIHQSSTQGREAKRQKLSDGAMKQHGRNCFVTIGATAGFRQLLAEIIQPDFLQCLAQYGYDVLEVQCGPDHAWFAAQTQALTDKKGIDIRSFKYTNNMQGYMLACSGTILEAIRYGAPVVVVPNPTLMDNHQAELAEECERQNWAIYGKLGNLAKAIRASHERLAQGGHDRDRDDNPLTQPYSPPPFPVPESERVTLFDWMVLTCYPEELARQKRLRVLGDVSQAFASEQQQKAVKMVMDREKDDRSRLQVD